MATVQVLVTEEGADPLVLEERELPIAATEAEATPTLTCPICGRAVTIDTTTTDAFAAHWQTEGHRLA